MIVPTSRLCSGSNGGRGIVEASPSSRDGFETNLVDEEGGFGVSARLKEPGLNSETALLQSAVGELMFWPRLGKEILVLANRPLCNTGVGS